MRENERMDRFMKKKFKFFATLIVFALMSSQMCFAAEKEDITNRIPTKIEVEGGVLELTDEPAAVVAQGVARYQYHVKTDGSNLNVRSGPGTDYSIIGKFANGAVIDIPFMQPSESTYTWRWAHGDDADTGKRIQGYININYIE